MESIYENRRSESKRRGTSNANDNTYRDYDLEDLLRMKKLDLAVLISDI